jgi:hypothetical protein
VINRLTLEGQIHRRVVQGIGQAFTEHLVYDRRSGQLLSGSFMDYGLLRADEVCFGEMEENPVPTKTNPLLIWKIALPSARRRYSGAEDLAIVGNCSLGIIGGAARRSALYNSLTNFVPDRAEGLNDIEAPIILFAEICRRGLSVRPGDRVDGASSDVLLRSAPPSRYR